jgi:hypothetical protein
LKGGTNFTNYIYEGGHFYNFRGTVLGSAISLELQLCNDAEPAGYSWTSQVTDNGSVNGVPAQTVNKIISTNGNMTVNGKNYTNVIHTQVDLQYDFGAGFESATTYDFYLAKGIGLIEADTNFSGTLMESSTLTSYSVK